MLSKGWSTEGFQPLLLKEAVQHRPQVPRGLSRLPGLRQLTSLVTLPSLFAHLKKKDDGAGTQLIGGS